MTDGRIPLAAVIGSPVAHSLSPALHGFWLRRMRLPGSYIPMDVAHENLREVLRAMPKMGFVGCNVTLPHKETVLGLADVVTDRASLIGAANTLIFREDGSIHADNTDGYGFLENLRQSHPGWRAGAGPAVVLGAGGAARAVLASLLEAGVPEIRLANRTRSRADALRSEFGMRVVVYDWNGIGAAIDDAALLINASSLGMTGKPELRVPLQRLHPNLLVTDLVYNPLQTQLLLEAEAAGCATVDGLGMLLHQAVPGFQRWFGARPEVDAETRRAILA